MQSLGLSKSDIDNLSGTEVYEYVIMISEINKMNKERSEARNNG